MLSRTLNTAPRLLAGSIVVELVLHKASTRYGDGDEQYELQLIYFLFYYSKETALQTLAKQLHKESLELQSQKYGQTDTKVPYEMYCNTKLF